MSMWMIRLEPGAGLDDDMCLNRSVRPTACVQVIHGVVLFHYHREIPRAVVAVPGYPVMRHSAIEIGRGNALSG
jgi:hypothetical protein